MFFQKQALTVSLFCALSIIRLNSQTIDFDKVPRLSQGKLTSIPTLFTVAKNPLFSFSPQYLSSLSIIERKLLTKPFDTFKVGDINRLNQQLTNPSQKPKRLSKQLRTKLKTLIESMKGMVRQKASGIEIASFAHRVMTSEAPFFIKCNLETTYLVMNFILMNFGYPPVIFHDLACYKQTLEKSLKEPKALTLFIAQAISDQFHWYKESSRQYTKKKKTYNYSKEDLLKIKDTMLSTHRE